MHIMNKLRGNKVLRWGYRTVIGILEYYRDFTAIKNFKMQNKKKQENNKKIRIGFLCQYIPAWNKTKPFYDKLKSDSRFEVVLICVPLDIHNINLKKGISTANDTYLYFTEHGYEVMNALEDNGRWVDLKKINLDYLFYPRPYNLYMPRPYRSRIVSKYTKICIVMYGMILTEEMAEALLNKDFFRNAYCYFAETKYIKQYNIQRFSKTHKLGLQKTVYYGMPALMEILQSKNQKNTAWDFSENTFRVLWTPRWTTDLKSGGSNFFSYKDVLLEYAENNSSVDILFRPHPMAFDNFIKTGEMTVAEAEAFKVTCEKRKNISLDKEKEYAATFWNSSVLITDISSILPEYFITEKPVIFCISNMYLTPIAHTKKMLEGCYVVKDKEELLQCLDDLKAGKDTLKEKRMEIIEDVFGTENMEWEQNFMKELENGIKK